MNFAREFAPAIFDEMKPLLEKHFHEIAHYQDIALDPDWDTYEKMEGLGLLRVYTARLNGVLVGYAVFFVKHNLHYKQSLQAVQDVLFIDPAKRGFGREFIPWCDEQLRLEKVQVVYHHVKKAHNFGPLLESIGYKEVDLIFGRRLD